MTLLCKHEWKEGVVLYPYTSITDVYGKYIVIEFWRMATKLISCQKCIKCGKSNIEY